MTQQVTPHGELRVVRVFTQLSWDAQSPGSPTSLHTLEHLPRSQLEPCGTQGFAVCLNAASRACRGAVPAWEVCLGCGREAEDKATVSGQRLHGQEQPPGQFHSSQRKVTEPSGKRAQWGWGGGCCTQTTATPGDAAWTRVRDAVPVLPLLAQT